MNTPSRILILGNSITRHRPKADVGWDVDWGMAASAIENDFAHILLKRFTEAARGVVPEAIVDNVATLEVDYATFDARKQLAEYADFKADVMVLAIGENVPELKTEEEQNRFRTVVTDFLTMIQESGTSKFYVRSSFWPNEVKDEMMRQACEAVGGTFVDIHHLADDESNYARSEREYWHDGVAAHPGDKGMAAIADAIWDAVTATE